MAEGRRAIIVPRMTIKGSSLMVALSVNGKIHDVNVDPSTPLLWVIREQVGLTGTKYGCGIAQCGACTVHVDGVAVRSCVDAGQRGRRQADHHHRGARAERRAAQGAEGLARPSRCRNAAIARAGMIMAVAALLKDKPKPTDADIDATITNICRCGTFQQVREAIHAAAKA